MRAAAATGGSPDDATVDGGQRAIQLAAFHLHVGTVRALLESGATPDLVDHEGLSVLHVAAQQATGDAADGGRAAAIATLIVERIGADAARVRKLVARRGGRLQQTAREVALEMLGAGIAPRTTLELERSLAVLSSVGGISREEALVDFVAFRQTLAARRANASSSVVF